MEVAAEKRRATDPAGEAKRQKELSEARAEKRKKEAAEADDDSQEVDKRLLVTLEQAESMEKKKEKKEKGKAAFGWDVFNQDTLYKAHKKRIKKLQPDIESYEAAKANDKDFFRDANSLSYGGAGYQPPTEKVEAMVEDLLDAAERRNKFSRRRPEVFEADVDYINDRNKHFNKKIDRAFGDYTKVAVCLLTFPAELVLPGHQRESRERNSFVNQLLLVSRNRRYIIRTCLRSFHAFLVPPTV
mmetsp:Transcript_34491/g.108130  ORF Transcript_34491/g.108130 Transcript_34491/m.108130 type:complete len:243 (+) Transcript_34491:301-1029(+)